MKTRIKKNFLAMFGKTYKLYVLKKDRVCDIIDYEINEEEVLEKLIDKHVNGTRTEALLNVETGKVEYYSFIGNTDLQQKGHFIELYNISGNIEDYLDIDDFLNEEEINKAVICPWDFIHDLDDYEDRLLSIWKTYFRGFNENYIKEQINKIYNSENRRLRG